MRIAIAGTGQLGVSLLRPLLDSPHKIVAVLQNGRAAKGIKRVMHESSARLFAFENSMVGQAVRTHIPIIWLDKLNDQELAPLRALDPDLILIGGFGIIFRKSILSLPRIGCVNAHTSLLPCHRGPNPFSAAILAGDAETGLTFHVVDEGIDTGPIIAQYPFPIEPDDAALDTYRKGCAMAAEHVLEIIGRIEQEGLDAIATPQDESRATYDKKFAKKDSVIDWTDSAEKTLRRIRACRPFFIPRFHCRNKTVILTIAKAEEHSGDEEPGTILALKPFVRVATGCGSIKILAAYCGSPFPWIWPTRWNAPKIGDKLE
jgi:methionyl-tRNA formyltransferase